MLQVPSALAGSNFPYLVKDINPNGDSLPEFLTAVGNRLFFNADDGVHGQELWVSDGTEAGTYMVIDLVPGPDGSVPQQLQEFKGKIIFQVDDNVNGMEWYISDGTAAGTHNVASVHQNGPGINFGVCSFTSYSAQAAGSYVFFLGQNAATGRELWRTDGTLQGTLLVKDIVPGPSSSGIQSLTAVGQKLFFSSLRLWVSDGTPQGTVQLTSEATAIWTKAVGERAFFQGQTAQAGEELWVSDGTAEGTFLVKDINPGPAHSDPILITDVNGTAFFTPFSPDYGRELWKSDGTEEGTILVADLNPGNSGGSIWELAELNGMLLFIRFNPDVGFWQLWKSDGSASGTVAVASLGSVTAGRPEHLVAVNGKMYFANNDEIHGREIWVSDGTADGTRLTGDVNPGPTPLNPNRLTGAGPLLFFRAFSPETGIELYAFDTTPPPIPATRGVILLILAIALLGAGYAIMVHRRCGIVLEERRKK